MSRDLIPESEADEQMDLPQTELVLGEVPTFRTIYSGHKMMILDSLKNAPPVVIILGAKK